MYIKKETFIATEDLFLENSYSILKEEKNVQLNVTIAIKDNEYGWFELYDVKTEGNDWYAEGSLQLEGKKVTGYDNVFSPPYPIIDKLKEWGYDVSDIE